MVRYLLRVGVHDGEVEDAILLVVSVIGCRYRLGHQVHSEPSDTTGFCGESSILLVRLYSFSSFVDIFGCHKSFLMIFSPSTVMCGGMFVAGFSFLSHTDANSARVPHLSYLSTHRYRKPLAGSLVHWQPISKFMVEQSASFSTCRG